MSPHWQDELVERARAHVPSHLLHYVLTGAGEQTSTREATDAWRAVRFAPHVLRDVRDPDISTSLLGSSVSSPLAIAPTSMQCLADPGGEVAMAQAAKDADTVVVVSSNAGRSFEEIGAVGAAWWLQAYLTADRRHVEPLLRRAGDAGARAVVLTVDTPFPGPKWDVDDSAFGDLTGVYGANHPEAVRGRTPGAEHARDLGVTDIARITEITGLPVVVKGVLRPDDARTAVDAGARAVWVSNHGGRQLDRAAPTASALPRVVAEVGQDAEVFVDGGIRSGLDALAASALGADGVFLGRLPFLGLATGGVEGVTTVLATLRAELHEALQLAGCRTLGDTRSLVQNG